jgi:N-methylhydantoinase A/oxoprolinase/acetone carboxylase beta subunit
MTDALRIGIDVGGTNTDAVMVDRSGHVVRWAKTPTTADPVRGIEAALHEVAGPEPIDRVALGTTHAVNAILQRRGLRRVGVLRLGAPGTLAVPPLAGWPPDLVAAIRGPVLVARGGVEVDGRMLALDRSQLVNYIDHLETEIGAIAIVGTFSPLDPAQELEAAEIVRERSGLPCSLGHDIGGLGLLERENATVLNAALGSVLDGVVDGLERAVAVFAPDVPCYLTQNDGSVMTPTYARRLPILTIGSGPSNSLRGAAALTGRTDALVVDVGGTSTDVGALVKGFPRESSVGVHVGGVGTNFRMPDLVSVAAGGGTMIEDGVLGAESVGPRLTSEALVFGGDTATLTDAAVAEGRTTIGNAAIVADRTDLAAAMGQAEARIADAIDQMRLSRAPADVVLVGGGAVLLRDELSGARSVERPTHADVANAIGAALAPVAGVAVRLAAVGEGERARAIERVTAEARDRAIAAGADPAALETLWVDEIPLAYLDRPMSRLRAKVVGPSAG